MKILNWNIILLILILLVNSLTLVANNNNPADSNSSSTDTTETWQAYQKIIASNSKQKLFQAFELSDSLLFDNNPELALSILNKAYKDSLYHNYSEKREIKVKMYDIYSYQWDFSKSVPLIKQIFRADSLRNDPGLMANSSLWVASTYSDSNDLENALAWIKKSKTYATKVDSTRILAYLYMLEGDIMSVNQDFPIAFEKYKKAEHYIKNFPVTNTSALIYLSLASVYSISEQYDISQKYNEMAKNIYLQLEDFSGAALAIYNIAIAYGNSGDTDKALLYALQSMDICKKEKNTYAISDMLSSCYALISQLYERREEWDLSLKYLKLSDELVLSNTAIETNLENLNQYIRFYTKLNDYENALKCVNLGDSLKTTNDQPCGENDFLTARLEFYQTFGFYEKALSFARELLANNRQETSDEVANLIAEFEAQKNLDKVTQEKQELDLLNTKKNLTIANQEKTILLIISLILLISIITIILYQRYKSKVKLSKLLNIKVEERTKELRLANDKLVAEIDDHKATTNQLLFAQRLTGVGEIASGLAHEIRNPLTNIIASMQILNAKYNLQDDEFADIIIRNAQNANVRVKELLNYSQPIDFKLETISLHRVISEVINLVKGKLNKENIKFQFTSSSKQDLVSIDKKQIHTVFLNFILNSIDAIKNTEKEGFIEISTHDEFNFVVIEFKDNGSGIEPNIISKIFQPFFTNKENGIGLGLNLAHKIIHQHGGIISVKSEVGIYTTITVKLLNIKS